METEIGRVASGPTMAGTTKAIGRIRSGPDVTDGPVAAHQAPLTRTAAWMLLRRAGRLRLLLLGRKTLRR